MASPGPNLLATVDLFQGLSQRELKQVFAASKPMRFEPGDAVVSEGDEDARFYLLLDGRARVTSGRRTLARLGPGDYFGEISLIDGEPRSATVTAETPLDVLTLARWHFRPLLKESPAMAHKVLLEMCRRVRELDKTPDH